MKRIKAYKMQLPHLQQKMLKRNQGRKKKKRNSNKQGNNNSNQVRGCHNSRLPREDLDRRQRKLTQMMSSRMLKKTNYNSEKSKEWKKCIGKSNM